MSVPNHPLLALVDASKNDLKRSLTNYIELQVEKQFGQLRNRIAKMIENGQIVLLNGLVSTQANNTTQDNEDEREQQQIRSVQKKSTKNVLTKQNDENSQPVTELDHHQRQSPNIASTSSGLLLRSSNRKRIQTKLFRDDDQSKIKRKCTTESTSKAKEDGDFEAGKDRHKIVILELNCTEPDCETILTSRELLRKYLWICHGRMPYKRLKGNVRHNQRGLTEYPCTECDTVCSTYPSLKSHWQYSHQTGKFQCSICRTFVANLRNKVEKHQRKEHKKDSLSGVTIDNEFDDEDEEEDYDDEDDEVEDEEEGKCEYRSESDSECEDCFNGVCQLNHDLVNENDASSSTGSDSELEEDQPTASVVNELIVISDDDEVIDEPY